MKRKRIDKSFIWDFNRFDFSRIPQEDLITETALKLWNDITEVIAECMRVPKTLKITLTLTYDELENS